MRAEIHENLIELLAKILASSETELEVEIPEGSVLFENYLNLKIIQTQAEEHLKKIRFITSDVYGQKLIHNLSEERGVTTPQTTYPAHAFEPPYPTPATKRTWLRLRLPKLKLPKVRARKKLVALGLPFVGLLLIVGLGFAVTTKQKAEVTLTLTAQTLTKSVEIIIKEGVTSDSKIKTLEGRKYSVDTSVQASLPTTGETVKGEKAQGEVTIYNKTDTDKKFKKGTSILYDKDDTELTFVTNEDVDIPASTEPTTGDIKAGSEKVKITAALVGKAYNLKKDTKLKIDGYKTSEFEAVITSETKGGDDWKVKTVLAADLTSLETALKAKAQTSNVANLNQKAPLGWKMIEKFVVTTQGTPTYNHKIGDEVEEVSGTLVGKISGTAYSLTDFNKLIEDMAKNLVPQGYAFNSMDKNYTADWLKEDATQVTFKFYVTPTIDETKLKNEIKGKSLKKAQEILDKINGVEQVEILINPRLFGKIPATIKNIAIIQEVAGK